MKKVEFEKRQSGLYDEYGREIPDTTPVEMPARFRNLGSDQLRAQVRGIITQEFSRLASQQGAETFEEADDFFVDDDADFVSPYEMTDMQEEAIVPPEPVDSPQEEVGEVKKEVHDED